MHDGARTCSPLASQIPYMPRNRYMCNYMICQALLLPLFFAVRKFFESQVQVLVGFLTRPVTADHTHDDPRNNEYCKYYECCLYHASVPLMCPRYSAMMIAEMNMPVSMYTKSI